MKTEDFDIQVPRDQIAQMPMEPRDHSKLLVYERCTGKSTHTKFYDLPKFLRDGDCLVFNNTRVIPARLRGSLDGSPMSEIVVVLLRKKGDIWEALVEVGEIPHYGHDIDFAGFFGTVTKLGEKVGKRSERLIEIRLSDEDKLDKAGEPPIPPYIHGYKGDPETYQTVYNKIRGSAAAPTAGLHFTVGLLEELRRSGIKLAFVTLHVGLDTFMPILEEYPEEHKMYTEFCEVPFEAARVINDTRREGHRVIGVGTTSVRTMESAHDGTYLKSYSDWTSLYILPGYKFKSIDGMITNFHYPKSTNLIMICALMGLDNVKKVYEEAVVHNYRFYSFGDAMLIL